MKKVMIVSFVINMMLVGCTEKSAQFIGAFIPEPEVENHELFDVNCTPGTVVLDSFYVHETTKAMLPYEHTNRLVFRNENGEFAVFYKDEERFYYDEKIVERYCVNADKEWSLGSEVSESYKISFEGSLPSGETMNLSGFMHKEKTWFPDSTTETGYYDSFQVYISDESYRDPKVRLVTWYDSEIVNRDDIDILEKPAEPTVNLLGVEYTNVHVGEYEHNGVEMAIYVQAGEGVIAFKSAEGELFVIM